jgi:hypothetical protein
MTKDVFAFNGQFNGCGTNVRQYSLPWSRGKRSFSCTKHAGQLYGLPSLLFNGWRVVSRGVKRPEREVDRSPPSSAEFKNGWSYASAPLLCLRRREEELDFLRRVRIIAKRCITFAMSVRLSAPNSAVPTGRIFPEIWHWRLLWKSLEKTQI